jgi:hypothetical protein
MAPTRIGTFGLHLIKILYSKKTLERLDHPLII